MKIVILDGYALNPGDLDWTMIEQFGELTVYDRTAPELIVERAKEAEIVLTNKAKISANDIEHLPKLKYIGELATGFDNIAIEAAKNKNIPVCNIPGYSTLSVAQLTWALILEHYNNVASRATEVKNGDWCNSLDFTHNHRGIIDLHGKTLGLIGLGSIGAEVAKIGLAFGMKIIAVVRNKDKYQLNDIEISTDTNYCFSNADIISLHCPLTNENKGMVNFELINQMKSNSIIINTARGALINETDLANALNQGVIAGAALDVLSQEPPLTNNPLLQAKNCIITPHIGWASLESRKKLLGIASKNIENFLIGKPSNVVNGVN